MLDRHEDTLVILAKNIAVEMHYHHAIQLVLSLDKPYDAVLDHQPIESVKGFLIDSDIPHACQSADSTVLVISVDATSSKGRLLKSHLLKRTFILIDELFSAEAIDEFLNFYWRCRDTPQHEFDPLYFLHKLSHEQRNITPFDARLLIAIDFINQDISKIIKVIDIARHISLSESRLRHLFTEQVGIPLTKYVLWVRMKVALREMLKPGVTLSDAAHQAGFTDHAHFTRTFRRMFGVSPSLLLKYGQFLQIFG
ncbi:AraC family transcriptional regulator [Tolypothrix sp. NIES-4075]|uniref:helix-turn-helix transcriptional regulator n=1 Tax=Tolypothrix sp. NIES-4075 TaxID=2005459 RepID=UPI000B5C28E9|nr:AraC family transcriptional regulator [Tolypothrix sp. NIES-4075]GAX42296.1 AraC family transcriptional regulator [Tolypothrix sp. NIES-4075]